MKRSGELVLHLKKLAVGVDDVEHLAEIQSARVRQARRETGNAVLRHITRHMPRRIGKITSEGSIYWVIKGFFRIRQRILGAEKCVNAQGRPSCALILSPELHFTELKPSRPFQGWRYLESVKAPADIGPENLAQSGLPDEMVLELRELGLI